MLRCIMLTILFMLLSIPTLKQTDGWNENANVTSVHSVC